MIAQFRVALPFTVHLQAGMQYREVEEERSVGRVTIYPPMQAEGSTPAIGTSKLVSIKAVNARLRPRSSAMSMEALNVDGVPALPMDLMQVDVHRGSFERGEGSDDPPVAEMFTIVNEFLLAIKAVANAYRLVPVEPESAIWRMEYMADDRTQLPTDPRKHAARTSAKFKYESNVLLPEAWNKAAAVRRTHPLNVWNELMCDAWRALPEIGPAIALANAAIEVLAKEAVEMLVPRGDVVERLWEWLTDRDEWWREPSIAALFSELLPAVGGKSLKDETRLWEAFQNLRTARNKLAHEGVAKIGNALVDEPRARSLLEKADEIVEWVEVQLPAEKRRPLYKAKPNVRFEIGFSNDLDAPIEVTSARLRAK